MAVCFGGGWPQNRTFASFTGARNVADFNVETMTLRPGIYFMDYALKKAWTAGCVQYAFVFKPAPEGLEIWKHKIGSEAKDDPELNSFFNWDRLADFENFGGIRLEVGSKVQRLCWPRTKGVDGQPWTKLWTLACYGWSEMFLDGCARTMFWSQMMALRTSQWPRGHGTAEYLLNLIVSYSILYLIIDCDCLSKMDEAPLVQQFLCHNLAV